MRILGLVGPKGSGKDTTADLLEELKISDGKISFAGPLKKICGEVFDLHHNFFHDVNLKEKPLKQTITLNSRNLRLIKNACVEWLDPYTDGGTRILYNPNKASISGIEGMEITTPRQLLQVIGTNFIRDRLFNEWHLHAAFSDKALSKLKENGIYCVTDVRFPNEYEFLRNKFGSDFKGFYIQRPEAEHKLAQATHPSETEVVKVKNAMGEEAMILKNDGTVEDLKNMLKTLDLQKEKDSKPTATKRKSRFVYVEKNGKSGN